jgi:hypothetical protein
MPLGVALAVESVENGAGVAVEQGGEDAVWGHTAYNGRGPFEAGKSGHAEAWEREGRERRPANVIRGYNNKRRGRRLKPCGYNGVGAERITRNRCGPEGILIIFNT